MSLANRCDRCGSLIPGEANFEKADFDLAIMISGELVSSYEDLCPNCMKAFKTMLTNFEQKGQEPKESKKPSPAPKVENTGSESETPLDKPVEPVADNTDIQDSHIEKPLANKVVKNIPIELKRPNRH